MVWVAVSVILLLCYLSVLGFYLYGWVQSGKNQPVSVPFEPVFVSIIVPTRNEGVNIPTLIQGLVHQSYPANKYEIIIVDDASEDDTAKETARAKAHHDKIILLSLKPDPAMNARKKRAIEAGIEVAKGELVVCTDADCRHPNGWLFGLVAQYASHGKKFIAAPVVYDTKPTLLSVFQTLDFLTLQGITAASVSTGFHTMCNGANIAYSRKVFYEVGGFQGIDKLPTGDDMLLMHKVFRKYPDDIAYLRSVEAIVSTNAAPDWFSFFQQRIRWASKAAYYDDKRIFWVLVLVYFFNVWLLVLFIAGFWRSGIWNLEFVILVFKTIGELAFLWPVAGFYQKKQWLWWFPFLQPFHIIYTVIAGWLGRFSSYQWKGRVVQKPSQII